MSTQRTEWPKTTSLLDHSRGLPLSGRRAAGVTRGETGCVYLRAARSRYKILRTVPDDTGCSRDQGNCPARRAVPIERMRETMGVRQTKMSVTTDPVRRRFFTTRPQRIRRSFSHGAESSRKAQTFSCFHLTLQHADCTTGRCFAENVSAVYSNTTAAPHEFFDHPPRHRHNPCVSESPRSSLSTRAYPLREWPVHFPS